MSSRASSPAPSLADAEPVAKHVVVGNSGRTDDDRFWIGVGKEVVRVRELYGNTLKAFHAWAIVRSNSDIKLTGKQAEAQQRKEEYVEWLQDHCSVLQAKMLCGMSEGEMNRIANLIDEGRVEGRNNDTKTIKAFIADTEDFGIQLDPPLTAKDKSDRGFYHPQLGEMLCPYNADWSQKSVRVNFRTPGTKVSWKIFPRFLYRDLEVNPDDLNEGLFLNTQLIRVFNRLIVQTQTEPNLTLEEKVAKALEERRGVPYAAYQMYHGMSSSSRIDNKAFQYEQFYDNLVGTLEDDDDLWEEVKEYYMRELLHEEDEEEEDPREKARRQRAAKLAAVKKAAKRPADALQSTPTPPAKRTKTVLGDVTNTGTIASTSSATPAEKPADRTRSKSGAKDRD